MASQLHMLNHNALNSNILLQITKILLESGAKIDTGDLVKFSSLHIACHFGHEKVNVNPKYMKCTYPNQTT